MEKESGGNNTHGNGNPHLSDSPHDEPKELRREDFKREFDMGDIDRDKRKLQKRLEANRRSAAESRQRRLNLIASLQQSVANMTAVIANLERENSELRHHFNYRRQEQQQQHLAESPRIMQYHLHSLLSHPGEQGKDG